jgi:inosine/xanthosine triphosphatase
MVIFNICVGSQNPSKINAVKLAFSKFFTNYRIFNISALSKIPSQPIGLEIIIQGAINRAERALNYLFEEKNLNKNLYGIGIEAGLVEITYARSNYMDYQFCVIMDEKKIITLGSGVAFEYPPSVIKKILNNRQMEIGNIIGKLANNTNLKNQGGAISYLSKKVINRTEILTQAVVCALLPRINTKEYEL